MKRKLLTATVSIVALAFMVSIASYATAAEKEMWYTGKIMKDGQFVTDNGEHYTLAGKEAPAALKNVDKRIEIKGTVMEKEGKKTLEIQSYKFSPTEMKHEMTHPAEKPASGY